jgi:hypothetical protein
MVRGLIVGNEVPVLQTAADARQVIRTSGVLSGVDDEYGIFGEYLPGTWSEWIWGAPMWHEKPRKVQAFLRNAGNVEDVKRFGSRSREKNVDFPSVYA